MKSRDKKKYFKILNDKTQIANFLQEIVENESEFVVIQESKSYLGEDASDLSIAMIADGIPRVGIIHLASLSKGCKAKIGRFLKNDSILKLAYDWKSTGAALREQGLYPGERIFDVSIAIRLLEAGLSKGKPTLKQMIDWYFPDDSRFDAISRPPEKSETGYYNDLALQCWALLALKDPLVEDLKQNDLVNTAKLEFAAIDAMIWLKECGIGVDPEKLYSLWEKFKKRYNREKQKMLDFFPQKININNHDILKAALNNHPKFKKDGITFQDTKDESLQPYAQEYPVIKSILTYRSTKKLLDAVSGCIGSIDPDTNRVYPTWKQLGSATGRMSCSEPPLHNTPRNDEIRSCFVAGKGKLFVIADFSQIELRIAAEISQDEEMIKAFRKGEDFHKRTASIITGKPISEVNQSDRESAKAVNFGILYGMGAKKLQSDARKKYGIEISIYKAEKYINSFFKHYKGFKQWSSNQGCSQELETRTLGGRARYWTRKEPPKSTELLNSPIQGTGADIIKKTMGYLPQRFDAGEVCLVAIIHDEIILEVDAQIAEQTAKDLKKLMKDAAEFFLKVVPVVVDVAISKSWAH